MFFRSGRRSRIFASFSQPASSVTMALAPEFDRRNSSASSPNSANSGIETMPERNAARCAIGNSSDCDRNTATRSPRTRPSAFSTLAKRRESSATSSNEVRVVRAVLVDIDQRQPAGAVGMAVAARGRDVEARRDVPAEIAVEFVVGGGFGEHADWRPWSSQDRFSCMAGLCPGHPRLVLCRKFKDVDARHKAGHDVERLF